VGPYREDPARAAWRGEPYAQAWLHYRRLRTIFVVLFVAFFAPIALSCLIGNAGWLLMPLPVTGLFACDRAIDGFRCPRCQEPFRNGVTLESNKCGNCGLRRWAPCDPDEL
jgi:hypothetical protein